MMKVKIGVLASLCLLIFFYTVPVSYTQDSSDFLFYYYDTQANTFIVESLDSTSSYELAQYNQSDHLHPIIGPGWSSSEKFFAWQYDSQQIYIQSLLDNQNLIYPSIIHSDANIRYAEWSPTRDILAILSTVDAGIGTQYFRFELIDVESESVIFQYEQEYQPFLVEQNQNNPIGGVSFRWDISGDNIFLSFPDAEIPSLHTIYRVSYLGDTAIFNEEISIQECSIPFTISRFGIAYKTPSTLINLMTEDSQTELTWNDNFTEQYIRRLDWSPNGEYALILTKSTCERSSESELWLLSVNDASIQNLNLVVKDDEWSSLKHWSNDSQYAWFLTTDTQMTIVDVANRNAMAIFEEDEGIVIAPDIQWSFDSRFLYIIVGKAQRTLLRYDIEMRSLSRIFPQIEDDNAILAVYSPSPNNNQVAFLGNCAKDSELCLYDFNTMEYSVIELPDNSIQTASYGSIIQWHPQGNWLFLGRFLNEGQVFLSLINLDQLSIKEIGACNIDGICFGWLNTGID